MQKMLKISCKKFSKCKKLKKEIYKIKRIINKYKIILLVIRCKKFKKKKKFKKLKKPKMCKKKIYSRAISIIIHNHKTFNLKKLNKIMI